MSDKYILEGHKAVKCNNLMNWAKWYESADRRVDKTTITPDVKVSTMFLGLNHNYGDGEPLIFETMVFGGKYDQEMERYSTWDEAKNGHKRWVGKIRAAIAAGGGKE